MSETSILCQVTVKESHRERGEEKGWLNKRMHTQKGRRREESEPREERNPEGKKKRGAKKKKTEAEGRQQLNLDFISF